MSRASGATTARRPREPSVIPAVLPSMRTSSGFTRSLLVGLALPLMGGLLLNGWRAAVLVGSLMACVVLATAVWRSVIPRGGLLRWHDAMLQGLTLALLLPAHFASSAVPYFPQAPPLWPLIPAAAIILVFTLWCMGSVSNCSAPVVTVLALVAVFGEYFPARSVLARDTVPHGDVLDAVYSPVGHMPWLRIPQPENGEALRGKSAGELLTRYNRGESPAEAATFSMESLIRDQLPPLDDLIIAGDPRPIGMGSAVLIIAAGLLMMWRGVITHTIPLIAIITATITFALAPIPLLISENGAQWGWGVIRPSTAGWQMGMTFVHYQLLAGPLLMVAVVLATQPGIRPLQPWARAVFGVMLGALAALLQLYVDVSIGAYMALLVCCLFVPALDRWLRRRVVV